MALDNAQFISELSITDPPGTDAVAEGDDHIRTVKRATQQSFPNVDAAVPQSAAQMGQMAIKNEVNVFTQTNVFQPVQTFEGRLDINGPNIRFNNDADRGLQWLDSTGTQSAWELLALQSASDNFHLGRYVGGVFQDVPFSVINATGQAVFGITDTLFTDGILIRRGAINNVTDIRFQTEASINRWIVRMDANSLNNDFVINRRDAAGVGLENAMAISATTGRVTFQNTLDLRKATDADFGGIDFEDSAGAARWSVLMLDSATNNQDWVLFRRNNVGGLLDAPLRVALLTGNIIMATLPTVNPGGSGVLWKSSGFIAIT